MKNYTTEEKFIKFDKWKALYYVVGAGPHVILFNGGTLTHCLKQFEHLFQYYDLEKFTIVIWDPPGNGKSRPPERDFTHDLYLENAEYAFELMKALNFNYYSVWGTCSGGATSMILAAKHPDVVRALFLSNTRSHYLPNDVKLMMQLKNVPREKPLIKARIDVYGEDMFTKQLMAHLDHVELLLKERNGNVCSHLLKDIKCPTFIVAGGKDILVDKSHASYLHENIRGSKLYVDPEYGHTPYYKYAIECSKMVQDFFTALTPTLV